MDLLIRNIDAKIVKQIDNKLAKINKNRTTKLSRNDYLKMILERQGSVDLEQYKKDKFDLVVGQQNKLLNENLKAMNRIFWLLVNGDDGQAGDLLEEMAEFEKTNGDE